MCEITNVCGDVMHVKWHPTGFEREPGKDASPNPPKFPDHLPIHTGSRPTSGLVTRLTALYIFVFPNPHWKRSVLTLQLHSKPASFRKHIVYRPPSAPAQGRHELPAGCPQCCFSVLQGYQPFYSHRRNRCHRRSTRWSR